MKWPSCYTVALTGYLCPLRLCHLCLCPCLCHPCLYPSLSASPSACSPFCATWAHY